MKQWEGKKGPPLNLAWGPRGLNPTLTTFIGSPYYQESTQGSRINLPLAYIGQASKDLSIILCDHSFDVSFRSLNLHLTDMISLFRDWCALREALL